MDTKIYQNKPKTAIYLVLTILLITGLIIYLVRYNDEKITSFLSMAIIGFLVYVVYTSLRLFIKLFRQGPVIVFSDHSVWVAGNFKNEIFSWNEIEDWRILSHADAKEIAFTIGGKQQFIEFSDLQTTSAEIRSILETMLPHKEFIGR